MTGQPIGSVRSLLHIVRVTIEAATPLSTSGEGSGGLYDTVILRDGNGLPTIAGSSIAGVLRHQAEKHLGSTRVRELFGFQDSGTNCGEPARLRFSFAAVHDSSNTARVGLITNLDVIEHDPLLRHLADDAPLHRDHVALNHRGVADERRKFDRTAVPKGTRFSFEITCWGRREEAEDDRRYIRAVVSLLGHPAFRLGGATRRGYGKINVITCRYRCCPTDDPLAIRAVRAQSPDQLTDSEDWLGTSEYRGSDVVSVRIKLRPLSALRIGGGKTPLAKDVNGDGKQKRAQLMAEPQIVWSLVSGSEKASVRYPASGDSEHRLVIPGSAIKGAINHRTAYHLRRLEGRVLDVDARPPVIDRLRPQKTDGRISSTQVDEALSGSFDREAELAALFGRAKSRDDDLPGATQSDVGVAGRVLIDDAELLALPGDIKIVVHNSIDRFTGGVRAGLLFSEEIVAQRASEQPQLEFEVPLTLLPSYACQSASGEKEEVLLHAFWHALDDLCNGRLSLGAKRLGYCSGENPWRTPEEFVAAVTPQDVESAA